MCRDLVALIEALVCDQVTGAKFEGFGKQYTPVSHIKTKRKRQKCILTVSLHDLKIAKERPQGSALCYVCFVSVEQSRQAWKNVAKAAKCKVLEP